MNFNKLGTLLTIGIGVVSFTAACGGSPTKASAIAPSLGDGASAASVNVSAPRSLGAEQTCTSQPQADQSGDQNGEMQNAEAPAVTCDSPANNGSDAAAQGDVADVVVSDTPMTDEAFSVRRFHR